MIVIILLPIDESPINNAEVIIIIYLCMRRAFAGNLKAIISRVDEPKID